MWANIARCNARAFIKVSLMSRGSSCSIEAKMCRLMSTTSESPKSAETEFLKHLSASIRMKGPISVADYMKEVLTNSVAGYYMYKDVFGRSGDFITSPEISQMFGELVGIWCVNEWLRSGSPNRLNIVEMGPGRGTLSDDMLRVFSKFPDLKKAVSLHLVEISPELSRIQRRKLTEQESSSKNETDTEEEHILGSRGNRTTSSTTDDVISCRSRYDVNVTWYKDLKNVPEGKMFLVAHEFFDALPIHKFQKKDNKWHEVLVDIDETSDSEQQLRFVLSPGGTVASSLLLGDVTHELRDHIELCPSGAVIINEIGRRIETDGGFALIVDYGHSGEKTDTFRAFKNHKLVNPLYQPGSADLTADVNFSYLMKNIQHRVSTYGPITQEKFLHNMGIGLRLEMLLTNASVEERKNLITGYDMLTNPTKMGERFKCLAILETLSDDYIPAGFAALR